MSKLSIKKGDPVMIIAGNDKGRTGEITSVDRDSNRVTVEGKDISKVIKHIKPKKAQQKGGRIEQPATIDASNVMVICNACSSHTRIGKKIEEVDGKPVKVRICKKCGASLDVSTSKSKATAKKATKKKKADAKAKAETKSE